MNKPEIIAALNELDGIEISAETTALKSDLQQVLDAESPLREALAQNIMLADENASAKDALEEAAEQINTLSSNNEKLEDKLKINTVEWKKKTYEVNYGTLYEGVRYTAEEIAKNPNVGTDAKGEGLTLVAALLKKEGTGVLTEMK
ncbi:MAG: hypothetical protein ACRBFS_22850 [Aureispira sp.]